MTSSTPSSPARRHEGPQVLRQAAAAVPGAGVQHAAADPLVVAECIRELGDVGAGGVAHLREGVDERDLRCQEGVRAALDQLGGRQVADDDRRTFGDRVRENLAQPGLGGRGLHAEDQAVRVQGVVDTVRLAQELRLPGDLDRLHRPGPRCGIAARRASTYRPGPWTGRPPGAAGSATVQHADDRVTWARSAASLPSCCGVPTQMKCTSAQSATSPVVLGEPQPAGVRRASSAADPDPARTAGPCRRSAASAGARRSRRRSRRSRTRPSPPRCSRRGSWCRSPRSAAVARWWWACLQSCGRLYRPGLTAMTGSWPDARMLCGVDHFPGPPGPGRGGFAVHCDS